MALVQTVNANDLYRMACKMNRGNNFGPDGWRAIGDYLESLSDDLGEDIEIDILGICCEYSMANSADEFADMYDEFMDEVDPEEWDEMTEEDKLVEIENFLQERTSVVSCEEGLIIWQAF